jgi:hypothetical protein
MAALNIGKSERGDDEAIQAKRKNIYKEIADQLKGDIDIL